MAYILSFYLYDFQHLSDMKAEKAKIIIADIYDEQARIVMCKAFKLEVSRHVFVIIPRLLKSGITRLIQNAIGLSIIGIISFFYVYYIYLIFAYGIFMGKNNKTECGWTVSIAAQV